MSLDYHNFPILYVDDERANLVSLRYALEDELTVITAGSGEEALQILAREQIAILIADQRMPVMTGVELCARARDVSPDTVRMILTAYADLKAAVDAINRGQVSRYIRKPWQPDEMVRLLKTAIDVYHFRQTAHELEAKLLQGERAVTADAVVAELDHELRNWFTVLYYALQVVARTADRLEGDIEAAAELADVAREGLEAIEMAKSLLGRYRRGETAVKEDVSADVTRVCDTAVTIMRGELSRRARYEVVVDGRPHAVVTPTELAQVLLNLLSNACQAIPEDAAAAEQRVSLLVRVVGSELEIAVSDTGCGIDPELQKRVFEPHYSSKPGGDGHGLGLAIIKKIVERRRGRLELDSTPGEGTTVKVWLPLMAR